MPYHLNRLLDIMARLRDPERGCPWDVEQTFDTILPYTIEEAYELGCAIESGVPSAIRDELGDLLLQVVFHARIAEEAGAFDFESVAEAICDKMVRRHPHVFGDGEPPSSAAAQTRAWEDLKAHERQSAKITGDRQTSAPQSRLAGVTESLPALTRAAKVQKRAAHAGFDWSSAADVLPKIREELGELEHEIKAGATGERLTEEMGDLLFALANLARKLKIDPETALRRGSRKFERRFNAMETLAWNRNLIFENLSLTEMEDLWTEVKANEPR